MTSAGETHVEEIRQDIACPGCEYNLRGLRGAVVNCPECGLRCDIAQLISRKWTKPWYQAPGLHTLQAPASIVVILLLVFPPGITFMLPPLFWLFLLAVLALLGVWGWLMWRAWSLFDGPIGLALALLQHAVLLAYFGGGLVVAIGAGLTIVQLIEGEYLVAMLGVGFVCLGSGAIILARYGEKYAAKRCIRRFLSKPPRE